MTRLQPHSRVSERGVETGEAVSGLTMRAVVITHAGGPEVLVVRDAARPIPGPDEILVRICASALNRADLLQRQGKYPAPAGWPADIPGLEFAGEVAECGSRARMWRTGQRVLGLVGGGAHAEFLVIHERAVAEVPEKLSWSEAAAVPEAFITAHDAMIAQAELRSGERVLIPAVGSGVGLAAAQLAQAIGAVAYGTSRTPDKIERARDYGIAEGAVVRDPIAELPRHTREWTDGSGFNVVLDLVGGPYAIAAVDALALKGRLILVGTVGGGRAELALGSVMSKRLTIRGTVMRARPLEERIIAVQKFATEVLPLFERGALRAVVDSEFPLDEIRAAHERLQSNATFGKVVVRMS